MRPRTSTSAGAMYSAMAHRLENTLFTSSSILSQGRSRPAPPPMREGRPRVSAAHAERAPPFVVTGFVAGGGFRRRRPAGPPPPRSRLLSAADGLVVGPGELFRRHLQAEQRLNL